MTPAEIQDNNRLRARVDEAEKALDLANRELAGLRERYGQKLEQLKTELELAQAQGDDLRRKWETAKATVEEQAALIVVWEGKLKAVGYQLNT